MSIPMISRFENVVKLHTETNESKIDLSSKPEKHIAIRDWLVSKFADALSLSAQEIDLKEPLTSYGLGSLQAIAIVGDLEDWLGRTLPPTLFWDYPTLEAIVNDMAEDSIIYSNSAE